jgi:hypothetical protein
MIRDIQRVFRKAIGVELTTIEKFYIHETNRDYLTRVDMGAAVSALHAKDIIVDEAANTVSFRHAGTTYLMPLLRLKEVKNANGIMIRPRVALTFDWNGKTYENIETSLVDRSKMRFEVLIGRNLIKRIDLPIRLSESEQFD